MPFEMVPFALPPGFVLEQSLEDAVHELVDDDLPPEDRAHLAALAGTTDPGELAVMLVQIARLSPVEAWQFGDRRAEILGRAHLAACVATLVRELAHHGVRLDPVRANALALAGRAPQHWSTGA